MIATMMTTKSRLIAWGQPPPAVRAEQSSAEGDAQTALTFANQRHRPAAVPKLSCHAGQSRWFVKRISYGVEGSLQCHLSSRRFKAFSREACFPR
jgi:hypothetical protein